MASIQHSHYLVGCIHCIYHTFHFASYILPCNPLHLVLQMYFHMFVWSEVYVAVGSWYCFHQLWRSKSREIWDHHAEQKKIVSQRKIWCFGTIIILVHHQLFIMVFRTGEPTTATSATTEQPNTRPPWFSLDSKDLETLRSASEPRTQALLPSSANKGSARMTYSRPRASHRDTRTLDWRSLKKWSQCMENCRICLRVKILRTQIYSQFSLWDSSTLFQSISPSNCWCPALDRREANLTRSRRHWMLKRAILSHEVKTQGSKIKMRAALRMKCTFWGEAWPYTVPISHPIPAFLGFLSRSETIFYRLRLGDTPGYPWLLHKSTKTVQCHPFYSFGYESVWKWRCIWILTGRRDSTGMEGTFFPDQTILEKRLIFEAPSEKMTLLRAIPTLTLICHSFWHIIRKYIWYNLLTFYSGILSDILFWHSIWHSILAVYLASILTSYLASCVASILTFSLASYLAFFCHMFNIRSSRLRSGGEHSDPWKSGELWGSGSRACSWGSTEEGGGWGEGGWLANIKSNNPHLTGGEIVRGSWIWSEGLVWVYLQASKFFDPNNTLFLIPWEYFLFLIIFFLILLTLALQWMSVQWLSLQRVADSDGSTAMSVTAVIVTATSNECHSNGCHSNFNFQFLREVFHESFVFNNFNFQFLREVSHESFILTSPTFVF